MNVEEGIVDPFLVDVDDIIAIVQEYFVEWSIPEELCLDSEVINRLSSVIRLQSDWIKHRSTSLYTDPFLLEDKIRRLPSKELAEIFLKTWNPIVEKEQLSIPSIKEAIEYWQKLIPLKERWPQFTPSKIEFGFTSREELIEERLLSDETFNGELEEFWRELKERVNENGKIQYWKFISEDSYSETVDRAYKTSFLVTYGYATLEINPLEDEIFIRPFDIQDTNLTGEVMNSIPISITSEEWSKWRKNKEN